MLPHLEVMLQNSSGATLLVRRQADEQPVEGLILQVARGVRALLFDVPDDWPRSSLTLQCELYCDGGVLEFTVPAVRVGQREIEFSKPQELRLIKNRGTVRVPADLEVELRRLDPAVLAAARGGYGGFGRPKDDHRVIDISGGGVALKSILPLELDQEFALYFPLPEWHVLGEVPIRVAHVIRAAQPEQPGLYGLTFESLTNRQRTNLYSLVAALLREHRQKRREEARRWLK